MHIQDVLRGDSMGSSYYYNNVKPKRPFNFYLKRRVVVMAKYGVLVEKIRELVEVLNDISKTGDVTKQLMKERFMIREIAGVLMIAPHSTRAYVGAFIKAVGTLIDMIQVGVFSGLSKEIVESYVTTIVMFYDMMRDEEKQIFEKILDNVIRVGREKMGV